MDEPLSVRLRARTKALHTEAERSGVMASLLRGQASRAQYAELLAALWPLYDALERGLARHATHPDLGPLARWHGLERRDAIRADLDALARLSVPIPPVHHLALEYAKHLDRLSETSPPLLLAHAWLRYLGDLNGGQIVARLVRDALQLPAEALQFYAFPALDDPRATAEAWRTTLDAIAMDADSAETLILEACEGFRRHIALFTALAQDAADSPSSAA